MRSRGRLNGSASLSVRLLMTRNRSSLHTRCPLEALFNCIVVDFWKVCRQIGIQVYRASFLGQNRRLVNIDRIFSESISVRVTRTAHSDNLISQHCRNEIVPPDVQRVPREKTAAYSARLQGSRNCTNPYRSAGARARGSEFRDFFAQSRGEEEDTDFPGHRFLLKSSTRDCDRSCNPVPSRPNQTGGGGRHGGRREEGHGERGEPDEGEVGRERARLLLPDQGRPPTPLPVVYRYITTEFRVPLFLREQTNLVVFSAA